MKNKTTAAFLAAFLAAGVAPSVCALGLGDLKTQTYLNERLVFTIPVRAYANEQVEPDQIAVSLASPEEYAQNGLVYPWSMGAVGFVVNQGAGGKLFIRGESRNTVTDLVVYLLINVTWPDGRIQKEFSALIDLRGVSDKKSVTGLASRAPVVQLGRVDDVRIPRAPLPVAVASAKPSKRRFAGFPSSSDFIDYTVQRGDALSLIAQKLRGDVKLPLHQYIRAITQANETTFKNGLSSLEVGQVIKVPNPKMLVSEQYNHTRQLDVDSGRPEYTVQYGDSLFLISQAFKPDGVSDQTFLSQIKQANRDKLTGNYLEPGLVLLIPGLSNVSESKEAASSRVVDSSEKAPSNEVIDPVQGNAQIVTELPDEVRILDKVEPKTNLSSIGGSVVSQGPKEFPEESELPVLSQLGNDPVAEGNVEASPVVSDQSIELMQANKELQNQLNLLQGKVATLQTDLRVMRRESQGLLSEIVSLKEQEPKEIDKPNFLRWALMFLVGLLSGGLAAFLYVKRAMGSVRHVSTELEVNSENARASVNNPLYPPVEKNVNQASGQFSASDYSDYDFAKSNYDYSHLYDVDRLQEEIKSTGSDAFVSGGRHGSILLSDIEGDELDTVKQFMESGHFDVAGKLLNAFMESNPLSLDAHLTALELESKVGDEQSLKMLAEKSKNALSSPDGAKRIDLHVSNLLRVSEINDIPELEKVETEQVDVIDLAQSQEVSIENLDALLEEANPVVNASENPTELYQVKVYMSYGHEDMAKLSLDEYLEKYPDDVNAHILQVELYARDGNSLAATALASELSDKYELDQEQASKLSEIESRLGRGDFYAENDGALKSTALMDECVDDTLLIEDQIAGMIDSEELASIDEETSQELKI